MEGRPKIFFKITPRRGVVEGQAVYGRRLVCMFSLNWKETQEGLKRRFGIKAVGLGLLYVFVSCCKKDALVSFDWARSSC